MTDTASYPKAAHRCLTQIGVRTARNILRVAHFLRFSSDLRSDRDANDVKAYTGDAFRASVVFMHAILEDTLREIARLKLRSASAEVLDGIPLSGASSIGQPRKLSLGALSAHGDKTVRELIHESVDQHLDRISFSSTRDIAAMLERIGVDLNGLRRYFPAVDAAIARRHRIVHQADMEIHENGERLTPIEASEVLKWCLAVGMCTMDMLSLASDLGDLQGTSPELVELREVRRLLETEAEKAGVF